MAAPPAELLVELPDNVRDAFERLYPEAASRTAEPLRARVRQHLRASDRALSKNEFVDTTLSHTLADGLCALLADWNSMTPIQRATVEAAVAYYALNEDAEEDLDSVIGFEDDAQVFNACARYLGRPDLQIVLE